MSKQIVSHSEADAMTLCELRHYYSYGEKITKKSKSQALDRGITGHEFMEIFFTILKDTSDWDKALSGLNEALAARLGTDDPVKIIYLASTITAFLEHYKSRILTWEIVEVEKEYRLDCGDFEYAFKIDALIKENYELKVVDWKFVYDFYQPNMVNLMPQLPRYIGAMRALGINVVSGYYAFLRYREIAAEGPGNRSNLLPMVPNEYRIQSSFREIITNSKRIAEKKSQPQEEWHRTALRAGNKLICNYCSFIDLCVEELNGGDGKFIRNYAFEPSTYGYVAEESS